MSQVELCVIFNPAAGKNRGEKRLASIRRAWGARAEFWPSQAPGHGVELAQQACRNGFRIVAAAGGDGTVHEVANGLLQAGVPDIHFAVIPIGSANDYDFSLKHALSQAADNGVYQVDVGLVREPSGRTKFFVCCLGLGFNGAVTLESRLIHYLQGVPLYGLATLRALWRRYACPLMEITLDGSAAPRVPTLGLSVMVGRREGNFEMAPDARLDDGWLDYVHAGALSRWEVLRYLLQLAKGSGPPRNHPQVRLGRCRRLHLSSEEPLVVHVDGEFFCIPEDHVRELDIEIVPEALRIEMLEET